MKLPRLRGLPIFWQTLILLLSALIVSQVLAIALTFALPAPRPDFNRLSDIADTLSGAVIERGERERPLRIATSPGPPARTRDMMEEARLTRRLAERLDASPADVRLYFEPDQRSGAPWDRGRHGRRVMMRRGEPIFFNTVVAGYRTPDGWRIVTTPPRPFIAAWQRRLILFFFISAFAMLPFAWLFARRLTRPIRRFADAADRLGADPNAPAVPEEGPAELRVTAHALNRMQGRLADYVRDRTAMIGAIAHDLRTPLARIAFRIEAAPEDVRTKVQADIEQMRAMIAATIGFVRNATQSNERLPVDLAALLGRIVTQDRETGRRIDLTVDRPATVAGDAGALTRLVQNLVDNAVTYGQAAHLALTTAGKDAIVTIADEGPGLPEDQIERLFNPFERGDPSRSRQTGGIGLGLTIARTIAEDHGGSLTLANGAERGLVARLALPLA